MTPEITGIVVGSSFALAGVILSGAVAIITARIERKQKEISFKIDGRLEELLKTTERLANAIGNKEGRAELKLENDAAISEPIQVQIVNEPIAIVIPKSEDKK